MQSPVRALRLLLIVAAVGAATALEAPRALPFLSSTDPAVDLVRVRAFLNSTTESVDVTVDTATLANAVFTVNAGGPALRQAQNGNLIHITGNSGGSPMDLRVDMVLAGVAPHTRVGWTVAPGSPGETRWEVYNLNSASPRVVDRFDASTEQTRFTTSADLLRDGGPIGPVPKASSHLQLAFYYPWYDSTSWSNPGLADRPLLPVSNDSLADVTRDFAQAKDAGLDGVAVSWQGKDFEGGWNHRRMLVCLDAAKAVGLRIATLFETTVANPRHDQVTASPDPATVLAWLEDIVDAYGTHPAYLEVDGKPVVIAYAAQRLNVDQWSSILARLRATGRDVFLIGEGVTNVRLPALDGLFLYASNTYRGQTIRDFDRTESLLTRTYMLLSSGGGRRLYLATVSPGYDDTRLDDGRVARVTPRDGGAYYDTQWQAALDMAADWVVVTSWNEWWENTEIAPSVGYGDLFVQRTKTWTARFRQINPTVEQGRRASVELERDEHEDAVPFHLQDHGTVRLDRVQRGLKP